MNAIQELINRLGRDTALNVAFVGMTLVLGLAAWLAIATLQSQYSELDRDIAKRESLLERSPDFKDSSMKLKQQLQETRQLLSDLEAKLPETPEESQFLHALSERAQATGVSLSDFRPGAVAQRSNCKDIDLKLRGTGSYASVCRWLDELRHLPRFARITHVTIAAPTAPGGDCLIDLQLNLVFGVHAQNTLASLVKS
ncbi:MAG: type 4a pilus biogenesis protein PilO [Aureliella sp.]|jgi:Tfp pilus assembly protein PilO